MSVYKKSILDLPLCIKIKLCNQSLILSFIDLHELHELHLVKKKKTVTKNFKKICNFHLSSLYYRHKISVINQL